MNIINDSDSSIKMPVDQHRQKRNLRIKLIVLFAAVVLTVILTVVLLLVNKKDPAPQPGPTPGPTPDPGPEPPQPIEHLDPKAFTWVGGVRWQDSQEFSHFFVEGDRHRARVDNNTNVPGLHAIQSDVLPKSLPYKFMIRLNITYFYPFDGTDMRIGISAKIPAGQANDTAFLNKSISHNWKGNKCYLDLMPQCENYLHPFNMNGTLFVYVDRQKGNIGYGNINNAFPRSNQTGDYAYRNVEFIKKDDIYLTFQSVIH